MTDSYKPTHWPQYPNKTQKIYSYFESRGGPLNELVFVGPQYFIKKYLMPRITKEQIDYAEKIIETHFGSKKIFNRDGWEYILNQYSGRLPISIHAVPEGSIQNVLTPLMTIHNTDSKCYWLTNYLETLLVQTWYPTTVATFSRHIKKIILKYLEETGDPSLINFKLHDFGFRGVSSPESAAIGGFGHLANFMGTDTLPAIIMAKEYYHHPMAGFSIPAAEHSTITSWGRDSEIFAYKNMINQFGDFPFYAVVSDSYNVYEACSRIWGKLLKEDVLKAKGTLVIRPDSGDPVEVNLKLLNILDDSFGSVKNEKGYKVLNPKVRLIQGDGVDSQAISNILEALKQKGWSADNIAFGMGGALLQKFDRDTFKFAFKCSYAEVDGIGRGVSKDPITDQGKRSKTGMFKDLPEIFRDGYLLVDTTLDQIRDRTNNGVSQK